MRYLIIFFVFLSLSCVKNKTSEIDFNEKSCYNYIIQQTEIGTRQPGSEEIEYLRGFIINELASANVKIEEQNFTYSIRDVEYDGVNIIASYYPRKSRRILLGAHYDSRLWSDRDEEKENHNQPVMGANDGASGVAVLLELGKMLEKNEPTSFGVDLIFFDAEDSGDYGENETWCHGSRFFAQNYQKEIPEKSIIIDMIGDEDLEIMIEQFSYQSNPSLVGEVWNTAKDLGFSQFKNKLGPAIYDDHVPLIEAGFNAIDIIDFNYEYWHTVEDTPDKCSEKSLEAVGQTITTIIYGN